MNIRGKMGKMMLFVTIIGVVLLLFHFAGLINETPISSTLTLFIHPENVETSDWYTKLLAALEALSVVGIIVGFFAPNYIDTTVTRGFATFLLSVVVFDFIAIWNILADSSGVVWATLMVSPLFIMALLTTIEWWLKKD